MLACVAIAAGWAPQQASTPPAQPSSPATADDEGEREVIVILRSGQQIQGVLTEATPERITLKVSGIAASFPMADVESYEFQKPFIERYRELRTAVGNDPSQIAQLAGWLRDRGRYELALSEVLRGLEINADHPECLRLKLELEAQIRLRAAKAANPLPDKGDIPGGGEAQPPKRPLARDFPLLTAAQVDLMKVYEVDLSERPRILIPREAMAALMEQHAGHPLIPVTKEGRDALLRKSPVEQLDVMFRLQARDLYSQVQVLDMPGAIRRFRDDVHATWLMNSCATVMCHGGTDAGRLMLATRRPNHDQTVYTNLLILQQYRTNDGRPLIDWENPEQSVLLQMGLPREDSLFPHPPAPIGAAGRDGFKRVFRNVDEQQFGKAAAWIRSMYKPRPDYQIPYVPAKPFEPPPVNSPAPAREGGGGNAEPSPR